MHYDLHSIAPMICLSCVSGSKAYGLDTPMSDDDVKGVYLARLEDVLTADAPKVVQDARHDVQYSELGEFCRQLELNNSGALELWACIGREQQLHCAEWLPSFFAGRRILSKRCYHTYSANAIAQMKRIRATREKALSPPSAPESLGDYASVLCPAGACPLKVWLGQAGLTLHDVAAKAVGKDVWALYAQRSVTGLFGADGSCVARPAVQPGAPFLAFMQVDSAAYSAQCRRVAQYNEWLAKRNDSRLVTSDRLAEGEGTYDVKHMAHVVRLLHTAREIATEGCIHVRRTHDNAFLRSIRAGLHPFSDVVEVVERELEALKPLFERANLPESPEMGDWEHDLAKLRIRLHDEQYHSKYPR